MPCRISKRKPRNTQKESSCYSGGLDIHSRVFVENFLKIIFVVGFLSYKKAINTLVLHTCSRGIQSIIRQDSVQVN